MKDYKETERRAAELREKAEQFRAEAGGNGFKSRAALLLEQEAEGLESLARQEKEEERAEIAIAASRGVNIITGEPANRSIGAIADPAAAEAFRAYIQRGETRAALVAGTDGNGGYVVAEPLHAPLIEKIRKRDPIFAGATHFDMSGGDTVMQLPYKATHGVVANATETGARSEQTEPTFTSTPLTAYDYYTDQRISQTMLDAVPNIENLLLGWIYGDIYEQFGNDCAVGNGSTKASGLFAATSVYTTKLSGSAGAIVAANFLTLYTALPPKYRANSGWLMNGATLAVASAFTFPGTGNTTPLVDFTGAVPTILGRRVLEATSAPDIGAANYPVAFGDLSQAYAIGEHAQPTILRDPYTAKPLVAFYGLARFAGAPWDAQALLLLKSNNT